MPLHAIVQPNLLLRTQKTPKPYGGCIFRYAAAVLNNFLIGNKIYDPRVLINLGSIFQIEGSLNQAINHINKAIQLKPGAMILVVAFNNLGNIYSKKRELEKALNYYQKAIKLEPQYLLSHYNIGILYEELGNINLAISEGSKILRNKL